MAGIRKGHSRPWNFVSSTFSWAGNGHLIQKDPQNILSKLHRLQTPVLQKERDIPKSFPAFLPPRPCKIRRKSHGNTEKGFSWRTYPSPSSIPVSWMSQDDWSYLAFQRENLGQMNQSHCKVLVGETFGIVFKYSPPFPILFPCNLSNPCLLDRTCTFYVINCSYINEYPSLILKTKHQFLINSFSSRKSVRHKLAGFLTGNFSCSCVGSAWYFLMEL